LKLNSTENVTKNIKKNPGSLKPLSKPEFSKDLNFCNEEDEFQLL